RQAYAVKYTDGKTGKKNMSVLTSIDGYRSIAIRSGELDGIDDAAFGPDIPIDGGDYPEWARVTVYRKGATRGFTATVRWKEYRAVRDGKLGRFWGEMPYTMLAKVAESHALRMAFAADLSGIYTEDEMAQAENLPPGPPAPPALDKGKAIDAESRPAPESPSSPTSAGGK